MQQMATIDDLKSYLEHGGNPNDTPNGKSFIHYCIDEDNGTMISFLIEKGADPTTPNCKNFPNPLHYAITKHSNNSVLALLNNVSNPNVRLHNGNTPLITAITSDNDAALKYLLQFDADPNITNKRGEIPLFHAIHRGNANAVKLLLDNHSETIIDNKSAIHYAAQLGQAECCLILLKHGIPRDLTNYKELTPLDIAQEIEDPSVELLLRTPNLPETTLDISFVKFLNDSFEPKIEEIRDQMADSQNKLPKKMKTFISHLITLERCHSRFVAFLQQRSSRLSEQIELLSQPTHDNLDKDISRLAVQLKNSFSKAIEVSMIEQQTSGQLLFSPNGIESHERWVSRTNDLQDFIDKIVSTGITKYGLKDDIALNLRKSKNEFEYVNELFKFVAGKTVPFQEEIVAFIIFSIRKLKSMPLNESVEVYERFFKVLIRQIEETNPELIRRQFKKAK